MFSCGPSELWQAVLGRNMLPDHRNIFIVLISQHIFNNSGLSAFIDGSRDPVSHYIFAKKCWVYHISMVRQEANDEF